MVDQAISPQTIAEYTSLWISEGFEELTSTITFFLYEMARNPAIQKRLYNELNDLVKANQWTFENILEVEYLNICVLGKIMLYVNVNTLLIIITINNYAYLYIIQFRNTAIVSS